MRFAWLKEKAAEEGSVQQGCMHPISMIRAAYNAAFWIFLIPFLTKIDYGTGFIAFTIIISMRLLINLYINNILKLTPAQFESFPFRIP